MNRFSVALLPFVLVCAACQTPGKIPSTPSDATAVLQRVVGSQYTVPLVSKQLPVGAIVDTNGNEDWLLFNYDYCLKRYLQPDGHLAMETSGPASVPSQTLTQKTEVNAVLAKIFRFLPGLEGAFSNTSVRAIRFPAFRFTRIPIGQIDLSKECMQKIHTRYQDRALDGRRIQGVSIVVEVLNADSIELQMEEATKLNSELTSKFNIHYDTENKLQISLPIFMAVGLKGLHYNQVLRGGIVPAPLPALHNSLELQKNQKPSFEIIPLSRRSHAH